MARFKVTQTREVPDERIVVFRGSAVEGEVHPGMILRLPIQPNHRLHVSIHRVGSACNEEGDEIELVVRGNPIFTKFLASHFWTNQTFDVEEGEE